MKGKIMETEFAAQAPVEAPASLEKKKGGKGWMICAIISILLLVGVSVFAVILFVSRDNTDVADLKKQVEEKDAKIATLEGEDSKEKDCNTDETMKEETPTEKVETPKETKTTTTTSGTINIDFNELKSAAKKTDNLKDYTEIKLMKYEDSDYIVAGGQAEENALGGGYYLYMYKENKAGATWKKLTGTQNGFSCERLSKLEKTVLRGLDTCYDESVGGNITIE